MELQLAKPKLSSALWEDGEQMNTWERRGTPGILNTQEFQEDLPQALALRLRVDWPAVQLEAIQEDLSDCLPRIVV